MTTMSRNYQEKRDYIRMQVSAPATLSLQDGSHIPLLCLDLSSSGAQLISSEPVMEGINAKLVIDSAGGPSAPLAANVIVRRVQQEDDQQFRIGLQIVDFID